MARRWTKEDDAVYVGRSVVNPRVWVVDGAHDAAGSLGVIKRWCEKNLRDGNQEFRWVKIDEDLWSMQIRAMVDA